MAILAGSVAAFIILLLSVDLDPVEWCALAAAGILAAALPGLGRRQFGRVERLFREFSQNRARAVLSVGVLTVAIRVCLLPVFPVPQPGVVDEYSHRLLAETLVSERMCNPTPPMWAHMETIQVIQKPTYASMYLPGQGIFLAAGKLLFRSLWAGVLLGVALMAMAVCWALQGWLPAEWALLGGIIAAARYGLFSYWANSYWGGAVAALGGALVIGAWPRMRSRAGVGSALLMGIGMALLVLTRPFEGALVCVPVGCAMVYWVAGLKRFLRPRAATRVFAPVLLVLAGTAVFLGYYNSRVTGDALKLPYAVNQETYGWPLTLPWFAPQPHQHSSKAMHDYYLWEVTEHRKITDPGHHLFVNINDGIMLWTFFAGPALTIFLLWLPWTVRDGRVRLPLAMVGAGIFAVAVEQSRYPHYLAPATAAFLIVLLQSARHMRAAGARRPAIYALARFVPVVLLVAVAARAAVPAFRTRDSGIGHYMSWCCNAPGNLERGRILERLDQTPGRHLVIVRYGPRHDALREWVYNEPDVDTAKVVWARDMGETANEELTRYFAARRIWLLDVGDDRPPPLLPYPANPAPNR